MKNIITIYRDHLHPIVDALLAAHACPIEIHEEDTKFLSVVFSAPILGRNLTIQENLEDIARQLFSATGVEYDIYDLIEVKEVY